MTIEYKGSFEEYHRQHAKYPDCFNLINYNDCIDQGLPEAEQCLSCHEYIQLLGEFYPKPPKDDNDQTNP